MRQRIWFALLTLVATLLVGLIPQASAVDGDNAAVDRYGEFNGTAYAASTNRVIQNGSFTIESWVRPNNFTGTDNFSMIAGQGQNGGGCFDRRLFFGLHKSGTTDKYQIHAGIGYCNSGDLNILTTQLVDANTWSHIALTVDKINSTQISIAIYLNGTSISTGTYRFYDIADDLFTIGATDLPNRTHFFYGRIDQVKVWNGALSQSEVQESRGLLGTSSSINETLIAVYDFNESAANTTLNDRSANSPNESLAATNLTITNKTIPTLGWIDDSKVYGTGSYTVSPPSVTNAVPGTFTYTSSNPSVISISGNTFTTGNVGRSEVTARFNPTDYNSYSWKTITIYVDVTRASQTITLNSLGTTSKSYPYSQQLSMSSSGGSGTGAITYQISSGGSASGCSLSNSSSTATLTATSSGTCRITARIAQDANYSEATSSYLAFTFNKAAQSALSISAVSGTYGTNIRLVTSGGSGSGAITYAISPGGSATGCQIINGDSLTSTSYGSCKVIATKATDINYLVESSSERSIDIAIGSSTTSMELAPGPLYFRQVKVLTVTTNVAGRVTFKANGKIIPGCKSLLVTSVTALAKSCSYKPATRGWVSLSVALNPSDTSFLPSSTTLQGLYIYQRSNRR